MNEISEEKTEPQGQFFEIHGSEFELNPVRHCFKPSVWRITHGVFLFGVGKHPLNGLTSHGVCLFPQFGMPDVLSPLYILLPDMAGDRFCATGRSGASLPVRAALANIALALILPVTFPVGRGIAQYLVMGAQHAVVVLIIYIPRKVI